MSSSSDWIDSIRHFDVQKRDFRNIGPKEGYIGDKSPNADYSTLYSIFSVLQFLLLLYAVASGSVGLVNFTTTSQAHCPVPCVNGEVGPPGENGTCTGLCFNGTNGTDGINGTFSASYPSFGQWYSNGVLDSSDGGISINYGGPAGTWIPVDNSDNSAIGVFNTNNATVFSSSGNGFNVVYNGVDNGWVTVSLFVTVFTQFSTFNVSYYEVNWQDPGNPFVVGNPKIDIVLEVDTVPTNLFYSISSNTRMQLPTGSTLQLYTMLPFTSTDIYYISQYNLLLQQ